MSQAGLKQQSVAAEGAQGQAEVAVPRRSGRYAIDEERKARETSELAADARQLLELNTLSNEELAWIEERRRARQPSEPARAQTHAVFVKEGDDDVALSALRPVYREPTLERVQLQFEDRSLNPVDNPLARSSLAPPAKGASALTRATVVGVGALALMSVGYLAAGVHFERPAAAGSVRMPAPGAKALHAAGPSTDSPSADSSAAARAADRALPVAAAAPPSVASRDIAWSYYEPAAQLRTLLPPNAAAERAAPAQAAAEVDHPSGWHRGRMLALQQMRQARAEAKAAASQDALPQQPTRDQIQRGVEQMRPALQQCAGEQHGTSTAHITVTGEGRVAQATIEGGFAGTPQGSCMARVLREAAFPRFTAPTLQVTYPFRL